MSQIKGVLLDFDGVLSSLIVRLGWPFYHAYKKVRPNATKEEVLQSIARMLKMILAVEKRGIFYLVRIIIKIGQILPMSVFHQLKFIINMLVLLRKNLTNISPEEKADDVLQFVTSRYKTAIITHAEREVIEKAYSQFTYLKDIDLILAQQDVEFMKPHPGGLQKAMKELGLAPHETIYVGDLPQDIKAGKRAGTRTIAVVNFKDAQKDKRLMLQKFKPDYIIDHIKDLPALLAEIDKGFQQ
jgi:phosphoglycolate phosphatase-like HAD superfamily hydrolase